MSDVISEVQPVPEVPEEVRHIPEELRDFACTENFAGLAVLSYFVAHRRYPTYDEFEFTMQALFARTVKHQRMIKEAA